MKTRYSKSSLQRLASDLLQQRWLFLLAIVGTNDCSSCFDNLFADFDWRGY